MASTLIQGVSYKKIISTDAVEYNLVPTDSNGNVFNEVTIEADTNTHGINIYLPEIASLNGNWNLSVIVVALSGSVNEVVVICGGSDLVGSVTNVKLLNDGSNVIMTPVSATEWSAVLTD
jgi:hypothetical protein